MAALLFVVAWGLIDFAEMRRIARTSRGDFVVFAVTFVATLTIALEVAIFVGVLASLLVYLNRTTHPSLTRVVPDARTPQRRFAPHGDSARLCPQLDILRIDGSLFFGAVEHVRDELEAARRERPEATHVLLVAQRRQLHRHRRLRKPGAGVALPARHAARRCTCAISSRTCTRRSSAAASSRVRARARMADQGRRDPRAVQAVRRARVHGLHGAHLHRVPRRAAQRDAAGRGGNRLGHHARRRRLVAIAVSTSTPRRCAAHRGSPRARRSTAPLLAHVPQTSPGRLRRGDRAREGRAAALAGGARAASRRARAPLRQRAARRARTRSACW